MRSLVPILAIVMFASAAPATSASDLVLPVELYSSDKARRLATRHEGALRELGATLYNCLPWLEVRRHSIGFFKAKHATGDERYLSVRVYVEQEPSARFAQLARDERAAAMFSRYVGDLLRRMAGSRALLDDPDLAGFTVIVEWVKQGARANGRAVHETIAVFVDKPVVAEYVAGRAGTPDIARRARVLGFDGETPLGEMRLAAWEDDFVTLYQVKGYRPPAGLDCRARR
jgi:hypothetical protein